MSYQVFRNSEGIVDAVNRISDGVSLPWNYITQSMDDETNELVVELRRWEAQNHPIDLSKGNNTSFLPISQEAEPINAIAVSYFPTPENSVLAGKTVQSALDETIVGMAEIKSALNLMIANNKPPTFYDALNDLNNKSLDAHTPNTPYNGGAWTENVGDWSIVSNQAKVTAVSGAHAIYDCGFGNRGSFEADVTIANVTTPQGVIFRYATHTSYWRAVYSNGKWFLQEIQGNTVSSRNNAIASGIVFGQTYKFKVLLDGNNISFLVNDGLVCSWTATTNLSATRFGIYASNSPSTLFKNTKAVNLG